MTSSEIPRITFGIIVLNGLPFLKYNLRSIYPFAHQIIVVEGACPAAASLATGDGHSTDGTLEMLERFKEEEDPEEKVVVVTAEDDGASNGFWNEKLEMSQAYACRATGQWLWQVDYDEFYLEDDMESVLNMLQSEPGLTGMSFPFLNFWGGFEFLEDGQWFRYKFPSVNRLFRWGEGYRYAEFRPPTVVDDQGRDTRFIQWVSHQRMRRAGIYMYHYTTVLPKQAREKVGYYANVTWSGDGFSAIHRWLQDSYYGLTDPYFIGEDGKARLQWLERYQGRHPGQIVRMREDLGSDRLEEAMRPTEDLERLLGSRSYIVGRWARRLQLFIGWHLGRSYSSVRRRLSIGARRLHLMRREV